MKRLNPSLYMDRRIDIYCKPRRGQEISRRFDSDAVYVSMAREKGPNHFRFYLADIGATEEWGYPTLMVGSDSPVSLPLFCTQRHGEETAARLK
jgi:hypothetical protein